MPDAVSTQKAYTCSCCTGAAHTPHNSLTLLDSAAGSLTQACSITHCQIAKCPSLLPPTHPTHKPDDTVGARTVAAEKAVVQTTSTLWYNGQHPGPICLPCRQKQCCALGRCPQPCPAPFPCSHLSHQHGHRAHRQCAARAAAAKQPAVHQHQHTRSRKQQ